MADIDEISGKKIVAGKDPHREFPGLDPRRHSGHKLFPTGGVALNACPGEFVGTALNSRLLDPGTKSGQLVPGIDVSAKSQMPEILQSPSEKVRGTNLARSPDIGKNTVEILGRGIQPDIHKRGARSFRDAGQWHRRPGNHAIKGRALPRPAQHRFDERVNPAIPTSLIGKALAAGIDFKVTLKTPIHLK